MSEHPSRTQEPHPNSEVLSLYHDGEGNPELLGGIEEHLKTCDECRAKLEMLRRLSSVLGAVPDRPAPLELFARVSDEIRRPAEPVPGRAHIIPLWVGKAAAILIVGFLGIVYWQSGNRSAPSVELALDQSEPSATTAPVTAKEHSREPSPRLDGRREAPAGGTLDEFAPQRAAGEIRIGRIVAGAPLGADTRKLTVAGSEGRDLGDLERELRRWADRTSVGAEAKQDGADGALAATLGLDRARERSQEESRTEDTEAEDARQGQTSYALDIEVPADRVDELLALVDAWQAPPETAPETAASGFQRLEKSERAGGRTGRNEERSATPDEVAPVAAQDDTAKEADKQDDDEVLALDKLDRGTLAGSAGKPSARAASPAGRKSARVRFRIVLEHRDEVPVEPPR